MFKIEDRETVLNLFSFLMELDMHGVPAGITETDGGLAIFYDKERVSKYEIYKLDMINNIMEACLSDNGDIKKYNNYFKTLFENGEIGTSEKELMIENEIMLNDLTEDVNPMIRELALRKLLEISKRK